MVMNQKMKEYIEIPLSMKKRLFGKLYLMMFHEQIDDGSMIIFQ